MPRGKKGSAPAEKTKQIPGITAEEIFFALAKDKLNKNHARLEELDAKTTQTEEKGRRRWSPKAIEDAVALIKESGGTIPKLLAEVQKRAGTGGAGTSAPSVGEVREYTVGSGKGKLVLSSLGLYEQAKPGAPAWATYNKDHIRIEFTKPTA